MINESCETCTHGPCNTSTSCLMCALNVNPDRFKSNYKQKQPEDLCKSCKYRNTYSCSQESYSTMHQKPQECYRPNADAKLKLIAKDISDYNLTEKTEPHVYLALLLDIQHIINSEKP